MNTELRFLDETSRRFIQHAIDGVNKAATLHDPGAWKYVAEDNLIQANRDRGMIELDPIATTIFKEMEQDEHSGGTAHWTIVNLTEIAKDASRWRTSFLVRALTGMQRDLSDFLEQRFAEKFPEEQVDWSTRREMALHSLEYSYLARHVLTDYNRNVLQFLLKMEDVSHLGNEVLFDLIHEQLKIL